MLYAKPNNMISLSNKLAFLNCTALLAFKLRMDKTNNGAMSANKMYILFTLIIIL